MKFILKRVISGETNAQVLIDMQVDDKVIKKLSYSIPIKEDDTEIILINKVKELCRQEKEKYKNKNKLKSLIALVDKEIKLEEEK